MAFSLQRNPAVRDGRAVVEFWIVILHHHFAVDDVLDRAVLDNGLGSDPFAQGCGGAGAVDHMLSDRFAVYIDIGPGRADGAGGPCAGGILRKELKFK